MIPNKSQGLVSSQINSFTQVSVQVIDRAQVEVPCTIQLAELSVVESIQLMAVI